MTEEKDGVHESLNQISGQKFRKAIPGLQKKRVENFSVPPKNVNQLVQISAKSVPLSFLSASYC